MKRTAVVLLNWNGLSLLEQFLPSVVMYTESEVADIYMIDNGSTDHSISFVQSQFPSVKIISLPDNLGFAGGYNSGLKEIDADYFVLLNSDVEVTAGWLSPLVGYADQHPETAVCQPKIKSYRQRDRFEYAGASGGYIDRLGYPFCRGRIFDTVEIDNRQYDESVEIFWASGACLFIRKSVFNQVGGFDERFFAHMEEIDLCWRVHLSGAKIVVVPQSEVYHLGGATLSVENPRKTYLNFRNNLLMLYKNLPKRSFRKIYCYRFLLDQVALLRFVLKGDKANALAVKQAYTDFQIMKRTYNQSDESPDLLRLFPYAQNNILIDYFLLRKRTFDLLRKQKGVQRLAFML